MQQVVLAFVDLKLRPAPELSIGAELDDLQSLFVKREWFQR